VKLLIQKLEKRAEETASFKKECKDVKTLSGRNKCKNTARNEAEKLRVKKVADYFINSLGQDELTKLNITKDDIRSNIEGNIIRKKILKQECDKKTSFCECQVKALVEVKLSHAFKQRLINMTETLADNNKKQSQDNVACTVKYAQKVLKAEYFYLGKINGTLDQKTISAIKNFQLANDLEDSGELNSETCRALKNKE
jgi:hypothetical protein